MPGHVRLGIDVGGTKILGVALPADGAGSAEVLAEHELPTRYGPAVLDAIDEAVGALRAALPEGSVVRGIGVGMPGLVSRTGVLRYGPNLPGVGDLDVASWLVERHGYPVAVDNDGNCAAWAEVGCGAAAGSAHALFIGLGTGISCGMVVEGQRVRGVHGFAGEPGHMTLLPGGPACACGRRGCWEALASGSALARQAQAAAASGSSQLAALAGGAPDAVRGEHVTAAVRAGDATAIGVADAFAEWVGMGVANLVHVLDPEAVVIGGSVVADEAVWIPRIVAAYDRHVLAGSLRPSTTVSGARMGRRAGAIGAALLIDGRNRTD